MGIETANIHEHDTADVNGTGVSIDSKSTDVRQWKITKCGTGISSTHFTVKASRTAVRLLRLCALTCAVRRAQV